MASISTIAVKNMGAYDVQFKVTSSTGKSTDTTHYFPVDKTESLDLDSLGLADGTEVWPVINIKDGRKDFACGTTVTYTKGAGTATYVAGGTTLDPSCALESD